MARQLRIPAEWEPHDCCWLAFPHLTDEWQGEAGLAAAQRTIGELCRTIAEIGAEDVRLLVADEALELRARDEVGESARVEYVRTCYGDCWTRDTLPLFGWGPDAERGALEFEFNGWGGKFEMPFDAEVGTWVAKRTGAERWLCDLVLEGGALEFNGSGTLITTDSCIRNDNRNPGLTRADARRVLDQCVRIERIVWLERGYTHDHTDGHVDMLARFADPQTVLCTRAEPTDLDYGVLLAAEHALREAGLTVVTLPSPGRVEGPDGAPIPANYCNFYIANEAVILPTWGVEADRQAEEVLSHAFPNRTVVGLRANELLWGGGAFHCVTQPEPASP